MKLTNPTDIELNMAFCEKVAGLKYHRPTDSELASGSYHQYEPNYTDSMDAVLPHLERHWLSVSIIEVVAGWHVRICYRGEQSAANPLGHHDAWALDKSLPRACVITLLRANGHEV